MTRTQLPVHVEGLAPRLAGWLTEATIPGLTACSCVGQRVELRVPEARLVVNLDGRFDRLVTCWISLHWVGSVPPARASRRVVTLEAPLTPRHLAARLIAEVAWARRHGRQPVEVTGRAA